ncbi:MAG: hypothetical protein PHC65_03670 [Methanobacteriaceae archaeon]|jgi:hypothetical protein|uniref:hypothetical protein n=1 Tax=Methanobrevibacter TaxID=2172 RepID=UPI00375934F0|nr:hypothetical protein [Methanobacteriaceae archaeon]MDD4593762.1 hypothetical protein [Methanobacteriaceae archaeon]
MSLTDFLNSLFYNVDENGNKKFNKMKTAVVIILIICLLSIVITLLNPYENLPIKPFEGSVNGTGLFNVTGNATPNSTVILSSPELNISGIEVHTNSNGTFFYTLKVPDNARNFTIDACYKDDPSVSNSTNQTKFQNRTLMNVTYKNGKYVGY